MREELKPFADWLDSFEAVFLKGSRRRPETTDYWSDTDLLILLGERPDPEDIKKYLKKLLPAEGREIHTGHDSITVRLVSGVSFTSWDIVFASPGYDVRAALWGCENELIHGDLNTFPPTSSPGTGAEHSFSYRNEQIEALWFGFYEAAKKICRGDNLIGLHIILGLAREYLVFGMMERDKAKGTNIHRFGGREELPEELILNGLGADSPRGALDYLENLANAVDGKLLKHVPDYRSRFPAYSNHLERSRQELSAGYGKGTRRCSEEAR